jgi:apolipoprotein N-acyltransferase
MTSLALKFILVWGWKRLVIAICAGMLAATAMAPLSVWPAMLVSLPVVVWLLDGVCAQTESRGRRMFSAFATGWGFGFGYFGLSLFWIGEAFLVDAETFAWALPFAVTLMPAGLALFWGGAAMLAITLWRPGFMRIIALAAGLSLFEWLRGTILTGFPWNTPGYAVDGLSSIAQLASVTGVFGLTFFVVLWGAAPAALADDSSDDRQRVARALGLAFVAVSLAGVAGYGIWRLSGADVAYHPSLHLRIVQPNIAQRDKWDVSKREEIFARYLQLTRTPPKTGSAMPLTHVIWPESALPVLIGELPEIRKEIAGLIASKPVFVMGAITRTTASAPNAARDVFNSVIALDGNGEIAGEYHKQRLVPFGEYLPLADWLEPLGLRTLVTLPIGFKSGNGGQTLEIGSTPAFAPLVCYEAIFPSHLERDQERPDWLLNVTNDAWFGQSSGPHQHFAQARMRAIEQGLPLVRAANTGISAVVDPFGRVLTRLNVGSKGVIDTKLPMALHPTPYARYGNYVFFALLGLAFLAVYGHFSRHGTTYLEKDAASSG